MTAEEVLNNQNGNMGGGVGRGGNNDPLHGIDEEEEEDDDGETEMITNPDGTKTAKRRERLEQNRISARESRKRKKTMIEELQRTVITLSRENKDLNDRNEGLRAQLMEIGSKYPNVIPIQAIMNGAPPPAPQQQPPGGPVDLGQHHSQAAYNPMAAYAWQQQHQQIPNPVGALAPQHQQPPPHAS